MRDQRYPCRLARGVGGQISTCVPTSNTRSGGQVEEPRCAGGTAVEEHEQFLTPRMHPWHLAGADGLATEEERRRVEVELEAGDVVHGGERVGDIGSSMNPKSELELVDARPDGGVRHAVRRIDAWHLGHAHRQEQRRLVQHLVVLEVRHERRRCRPRILEQIHRGAGHTRDVGIERLLSDLLHRSLAAADPRGHQLAAAPPRRHLDHQAESDRQREPAAGRDLRHVGGEERGVDQHERRERGDRPRRRPPPPVPNDAVEQQRRDHHRRGDGDAVRRREGARRAETDDEPHAPDHQQPVHERHVHLADVRAPTCGGS